ncbi:hypothetical protein FS842_008751 [Serendipita sp. 407]|nr:hypothetical protein FS842_008751 [Serendipita sp. 407]
MITATLLLLLPLAARAIEISEVQGNTFLSPYNGKTVTGVTGLVTANSSSGFYLSSNATGGSPYGNAIYVYSTSKTVLAQVAVGDIVSLNGKVQEYRSSVDYLFLTEITSPTNITKLSSGNAVTPIVIGAEGLHPPTQQFTSLDVGGPLSVPNNFTQVSTANPTLQPDKYGFDFWEGLSGQLVKITKPTAIAYPNSFKDFWVRGDWPVTGLNQRGGLTITTGSDGLPDMNPEAIIIGAPLDGTNNPDVWMGSTVNDIVGVATYAFGFYRILPLTAPQVIAHNETSQAPTTLTVPTDDANCTLTFGDYNVENMTWNSTHLPLAAAQIGDYLKNPDLVFNPGRIEPANEAWAATRKPLVAQFKSIPSGEDIFAINVHMSSKGGSSSVHGNARPPVNGVVDKRIAQVKLLADFVGSILAINVNVSVIASGDFNEYGQTGAVFDSLRVHLEDIDEAAGIPPTERYTYVFDMNSQQLDHAFISSKLQKGAEVEHLHVNNWVKYSARTSDHDPSVSRVKICTPHVDPPTPACTTRQIGSWCAARLPTFNNLATCAAAAAQCWKDSFTCYGAVPFPQNTQCASYQTQCIKDSAYCAKCLTGKCGPSFP